MITVEQKKEELIEKGLHLYSIECYETKDVEIVCAKSSGEAIYWYLTEYSDSVRTNECTPLEEIQEIDWLEELKVGEDGGASWGEPPYVTTYAEEYYWWIVNGNGLYKPPFKAGFKEI